MTEKMESLGRRLANLKSLSTNLQAAATGAQRMYGELLQQLANIAKFDGFIVDITSSAEYDASITWTKRGTDGIEDGERREIKFRAQQIELLGFRQFNGGDITTKHIRVDFKVR